MRQLPHGPACLPQLRGAALVLLACRNYGHAYDGFRPPAFLVFAAVRIAFGSCTHGLPSSKIAAVPLSTYWAHRSRLVLMGYRIREKETGVFYEIPMAE
jgi:hypothetical protein